MCIEPEPNLVEWLDNTIHSPYSMEFVETMDRNDLTQFVIKMMVDLHPDLLETPDSVKLNIPYDSNDL